MARERKGSKMHSKVVNPYFPGQEHYFNLSPREAVIAAFALYTMGNPVESQWEELYGSTVKITTAGFLCGNWRANIV
jgi:hypothetical protein